eukprot:8544645-Alexandrium_andersonii.AAC.1
MAPRSGVATPSGAAARNSWVPPRLTSGASRRLRATVRQPYWDISRIPTCPRSETWRWMASC